MPAYFYHLRLQISPSSSASLSEVQSAWEALQPFQTQPLRSTVPPTEHTPPTPENALAHHKLPTRETHTPPQIHKRVDPYTGTPTLTNDKRFGAITIEAINMVPPSHESTKRSKRSAEEPENLVAAGIGTDILGGLRTRGRYIPLEGEVVDSVCGIVHLYRDTHETPYLNDAEYPVHLKGSAAAARHPVERNLPASSKGLAAYPFPAQNPDEDCKTLCILAVPSYLSPPDFLGFMGEKTMDDVSHFRMIRTARANRYMVLMKFRSGKQATDWQKEWNGKVFNSMEPETCHVVFVKTVEIQVVSDDPALSPAEHAHLPSPSLSTPSGQATLTGKPLAPPTPALVELPTCPVCLERMDETTGLLTIICQHVFHCTCLQKWKGSGCPVCRYTQDDFRKSNAGLKLEEEEQECHICHTEDNLWACLICGTIGCGRYDGAHAFEHWKETAHAFSMDLTSQRVWDYVGDAYVHRIIQSKTDGKLVELPAADHSALDPDWSDAVPREKLENMSVEYTHLLTSQLESQRAYFEEIVERAVDKASKASAAAAAAEVNVSNATTRLADLQSKYDTMSIETLPSLDHDRARAEKRAEKFEALSRTFEKKYQEERSMNQNMMQRLDLLDKEVQGLKSSNADLAEQNRDLTFFISGSQRLQGQGEEVEQGTLSVPDPPKKNKKKGKK
ncbi:unnamed protein product [Penicillium salamii]|uniref:Uncharacterized protein n=1 Tax=Penicillium salamii TaxID=1612424 RepID=A0A9W4JV80_9EURO|nr:unnamed protein product [Penicillium salamii]CAG8332057.1 unnamed protein product [Penicillium salamii]CAG8359651.1 unnamed protein product [Penicillium salamii]CAG8372093.1 unnamed protein product [Penicillium salamii]CAG8412255.1 unnamed protein product [Penicillium salamii]